MQERLLKLYTILEKNYGKMNWWPADTIFEIIVGAVLTQNTNWGNVEKSIKKLKSENMLDFNKILQADEALLKNLIKSSGFYNIKAKRLKNLIHCLNELCSGNFETLKKYSLNDLRNILLNVNGIGKETADSILLYALNFPIFVVDTYTKRLFKRLGDNLYENYDELQKMFHENLENDTEMFKEYHALIVNICKDFCKKNPKCDNCPLNSECKYYNSKLPVG